MARASWPAGPASLPASSCPGWGGSWKEDKGVYAVGEAYRDPPAAQWEGAAPCRPPHPAPSPKPLAIDPGATSSEPLAAKIVATAGTPPPYLATKMSLRPALIPSGDLVTGQDGRRRGVVGLPRGWPGRLSASPRAMRLRRIRGVQLRWSPPSQRWPSRRSDPSYSYCPNHPPLCHGPAQYLCRRPAWPTTLGA